MSSRWQRDFLLSKVLDFVSHYVDTTDRIMREGVERESGKVEKDSDEESEVFFGAEGTDSDFSCLALLKDERVGKAFEGFS